MTAQYDNPHWTEDERVQVNRSVRRVLIIEGLANLLVLIAKLWVGLITGSMAVLGDAIHSLSDLINNLVAFFVIRLSQQPADRQHPYGHHKFETLAVFALASLLTILAFELAVNAVRYELKPVSTEPVFVVMMLSVLVINILVAGWQRRQAKKLNSALLQADANHTFGDVLVTLSVIVGWQLSAQGYMWVDRLMAIAVSLLIFYLAFDLFRRALPTLVDEFAVDPEKVVKLVAQQPGVCQVLQVRSRWIGNQRAVDMVITVDANMTTESAHQITERIEQQLTEQLEVKDISIHVEPEPSN